MVAKTCEYIGVARHKRHGKYHARLTVQGRDIHLGYFVDRVVAALARDRAKYRATGRREELNFPDHPQLDSIVPDGIPSDPMGDGRGA
jgi:hypothetical protein